MPRGRPKKPRHAAGLLITCAAVLFAGACGGDSDSSGESTGGGDNPFTAYVDCMRNNGVTIIMPSGAGPGGPPEGTVPSGAPLPAGSAGTPSGGLPSGGPFGKPDGVDDATWQKAQSACASVMPGGMGGRNGG